MQVFLQEMCNYSYEGKRDPQNNVSSPYIYLYVHKVWTLKVAFNLHTKPGQSM